MQTPVMQDADPDQTGQPVIGGTPRKSGEPMGEAVTRSTLRQQNAAYRGTTGVSACNRTSGFVPAFLDPETGRASRT